MPDPKTRLAATPEGRTRVPHELPDEEFSGLRELVADVDDSTRAFMERYPDDVACKAGCSECCRSFFEVSLTEGLYLAKGVAALPPKQREAAIARAVEALNRQGKSRKAGDPHIREPKVFVKDLDLDFARSLGGVYCPLLDEKGGCSIYPWRPMVCRYYGYPRPHSAHPDKLDYCYLNFRKMRAEGREPVEVPAMDVKGWYERLEAAETEVTGRLFGDGQIRYTATIAEYVAAAGRTLGEWDRFLTPLRDPVVKAVRRFFEVLGARYETRRALVDPYAADRAQEWGAEHLNDPAVADDMDLVVNACVSKLSGEPIDAQAAARVLRSRGPGFRTYALLLSLHVVAQAAEEEGEA